VEWGRSNSHVERGELTGAVYTLAKWSGGGVIATWRGVSYWTGTDA